MKHETAVCSVQHKSSQISTNMKLNLFNFSRGHRAVFQIQR